MIAALKHLLCWWSGCEMNPQDSTPIDQFPRCMHCGGEVGYSDLVGDTRRARFMDRLRMLSPMRLLPSKCGDCGKRFSSHDQCDDIPF